MKVKFWRGELYPVYGVGIGGYSGNEGEIPEDLWKRYLEAREQFSDLLSEVEEYLG